MYFLIDRVLFSPNYLLIIIELNEADVLFTYKGLEDYLCFKSFV